MKLQQLFEMADEMSSKSLGDELLDDMDDVDNPDEELECPECNGTGESSPRHVCSKCDGTGKVQNDTDEEDRRDHDREDREWEKEAGLD